MLSFIIATLVMMSLYSNGIVTKTSGKILLKKKDHQNSDHGTKSLRGHQNPNNKGKSKGPSRLPTECKVGKNKGSRGEATVDQHDLSSSDGVDGIIRVIE